MTQLTATDLQNAKQDVDTIAGIANSTANTVIVTGKQIGRAHV